MGRHSPEDWPPRQGPGYGQQQWQPPRWDPEAHDPTSRQQQQPGPSRPGPRQQPPARPGQPQHPRQQQAPIAPPGPRRPHRRKRSRGPLIAVSGAVAVIALVVIVIAMSPGGSTTSAPPAAAATPAATAHAAKAAKSGASRTAAIAACQNRPAPAGDIYLRMLSPGSGWQAQQLGDEYSWDYTTNTCLDGVQYMLATAPTGAGNCTQAGYVKDNPGYNPDATPAAPLKVIADQAGPGC